MTGPVPIAAVAPTQSTQAPVEAKPSPELVEAAEDFEALILGIMMKSMRATVNKSDLFGETKHIETYESLLDTEYAKNMAKQGGMGFAEMIVRQYGSGPDGAEALRQAVSGVGGAARGYEAYGDAMAAPPVLPIGGDQ